MRQTRCFPPSSTPPSASSALVTQVGRAAKEQGLSSWAWADVSVSAWEGVCHTLSTFAQIYGQWSLRRGNNRQDPPPSDSFTPPPLQKKPSRGKEPEFQGSHVCHSELTKAPISGDTVKVETQAEDAGHEGGRAEPAGVLGWSASKNQAPSAQLETT